MASRGGRLAQPDSQGQYVRQLGWKDSGSRGRVQHKFRLGTDQREAERRDDRLRQLWDQIMKGRGAEAEEARCWDRSPLEPQRSTLRCPGFRNTGCCRRGNCLSLNVCLARAGRLCFTTTAPPGRSFVLITGEQRWPVADLIENPPACYRPG